MRRIFFLFHQRDIARLLRFLNAKRPAISLDTVVTCLPGIDTTPLAQIATAKNISLLPFEGCLSRYGITQMAISEVETDLVLTLLSAEAVDPVMEQEGLGGAIGIRDALLNLTGLLIHNSVAFEIVFSRLKEDGVAEAMCFDPGGRFALVERLDVALLLHPSLMMAPHLQALCAAKGVRFKHIGHAVTGVAPARNALRNILLRTYKAAKLFHRSYTHWNAAEPATENGNTVLFAIRADTELSSARPLIDALNSRDAGGAQLFVDDLLKSPTASCAARASGLSWIHAHSQTSPAEVLAILAGTWVRTNRAIRGILRRHRELGTPLGRFGFLGSTRPVRSILKTAMASVPELVLFARQLDRMVARTNPKALVSFDTIDRWGPVQGAIGAQRGVQTLMVQNTALDFIRYPLPLATDHLIVANQGLRKLMLSSGAAPNRVHATGLPQHDQLVQKGNARIVSREAAVRANNRLPLRVLVATQPFVQTCDYNGQMLDDLTIALTQIGLTTEIIVKPHPREAAGRYTVALEGMNRAGTPARLLACDFEDAMDVVDIVVSRTSTCLQLSAVGGLPCISYLRSYPADIITRLDYLKDPVVDKCLTVTDLTEALRAYANPAARAESLSNFAERRSAYLAAQFPGGGRATEAAIKLLDRSAATAGTTR
jgi:hypothetical protein